MSLGKSKEEQELTSLLAQTLVVKEVLEPMSKIGWGHGTPPPPDFGGQPAPPEGAPGQPAAPAAPARSGQPATPAAAPATPAAAKADTPESVDVVALYESLRDPATGLIGGKYKTVDEAIKGSVHLVSMAKEAFRSRDEATRQLRQIETLRQTPAPVAPAAAPRSTTSPTPSRAKVDAAQAKLDGVLSQITQNGGVLDEDTAKAFSEATREVVDAAAEIRAYEARDTQKDAEDAEKADWNKVDQFMAESHPDSARFSEEVALFIESDPLLARTIQTLLASKSYEGKRDATELAWNAFERAHRNQVTAEAQKTDETREAELAAREQVRKEQLASARKDAGVVTGSAGGAGVHENTRPGVSREELDHLREQMRREGDSPGSPAAAAFRRAIIPLDPSIFGPQ